MVRPLFIPAFWPRPHPFQVQIVPVRDISQLLWLLYVAVTSLKFPRTAMIAAIGTVQITVVNPQPGGGSSNAVSLSIVNPVPRVTSLAPATAVAGSDTFSLIVNGSNFLPGSLIQWNRNSRTTTFVSSTQLTATIPAGDVAVVGNVQISVLNPPPGGGSSNSLLFSIVNPAPVINSLA